MAENSLDSVTGAIGAAWGPLTSELIAGCRRHLESLAGAPATEAWLAALHRERAGSTELCRSSDHGFVLLAHTENPGLYRPPHDHGRGWVIYAVQSGEIEMGSYARIAGEDGRHQLVKRDATLVRPGQARVYLPGDIHDTLCVSGPALLFRFTDRDLKREEQAGQGITRYVERDGRWVAGLA